jgi:hypothetical protein
MFVGGKPLGYESLINDMGGLAVAFCEFKLSVILLNASAALSGGTQM